MKHLKKFEQFALLTESEEVIVKKTNTEVDNLLKDLEKTGMDLKDVGTQKDLIAAIIDSDFDLDKIDVDDIKEGNRFVNESHGSSGAIIHWMVEFVDNTETAENIAHHLKIKKEKIQWIFNIIKKVVHGAAWVLELIEKAIFKVARLIGLSIESSKATSTATMAILGICCLIFTILHAGPEVATLAGFGLALKVAVLMVKSWAGIKSFYNKSKDFFQEVKRKNYTINDFLDDIGPYVQKLGGEEFSTNVIFALDKWYDKLGQNKNNIESYFQKIVRILDSGRGVSKQKIENHINNIIENVDKNQRDVIKFFQELKRTLLGRKLQTV